MSDHVGEHGATCGAPKMRYTPHGRVREHGPGFVIFPSPFFRPQQSDASGLLMNACCNLNTERSASESLRSHSDKISTFFDSDGVNPGSALQTGTAREHTVSSVVPKQQYKQCLFAQAGHV